MTHSRPDLQLRYEAEGSGVHRYDAAGFWDRRYHQRRFGLIEALLCALLAEGDAFLDVGCGTGDYLGLAAALDAHVVGVDLSESYCRRVVRRSLGPVVVGDAAALPVGSRSCDVVLCSEVIEHLPAPAARRCIDELTRVARRAAIVTTPNAGAVVRRVARRVARTKVDALDDEVGHINLLDARELVEMLRRPGWHVSSLAVRHVAPPIVGDGPVPLPSRAAPAVGWLERRADRWFGPTGNVMIAVLEADTA